jgi:putative cardiolipin synthase
VLTNGVGATDEKLVYWRYSKIPARDAEDRRPLYEVSPTLARDVGLFGAFGLSFRRLHAKVAVIDRQRLFIGSMNFDPRSAWSNTESGLMVESRSWPIRSPTCSTRTQCRHLSPAPGRRRRDHRMGGARQRRQGACRREEPDHNWLERLKLWLIGPLASEELL